MDGESGLLIGRGGGGGRISEVLKPGAKEDILLTDIGEDEGDASVVGGV